MITIGNITKIVSVNSEKYFEIATSISKKFELKDNHPDKFMIFNDEKDSIGINDLVEAKNWIYKKPYSSDKKLLFIIGAEVLTRQAQNSLLKIIEEPPQFAHIYLITNNYSKLLDTIISRSEIINKTKVEEKINKVELEFLKGNIVKRIEIAEKYSKKKRGEIQNFLENLALIVSNNDEYKNIKSTILESQKYLSANVPKRNILENLAIKID